MQPKALVNSAEPTISSFVDARDRLTDIIRLELVGPDNDIDDAFLLEEKLEIERPLQRYKAGVLYPKPQDVEDSESLEKDAATIDLPTPEAQEAENVISKQAEEAILNMQKRSFSEDSENPNQEELISDLAFSGLQRPASMAISFFVPTQAEGAKALFSFSAGVYKSSKEDKACKRTPIYLRAEVPLKNILNGSAPLELTPETEGEIGPLKIKLKIYIRKHTQGVLVTYSAINETPVNIGGEKLKNDLRCAFQAQLKVKIVTSDNSEVVDGICAYPSVLHNSHDFEEKSLSLLYRDFEMFAVGHGCSAEWQKHNDGHVSSVWSTAFPSYETYSITPELKREDGTPISVSMADLAGLDDEERGFEAISELIQRYETWINQKRLQIPGLPIEHHEAALKNLSDCERSLARIREGCDFIQNDDKAGQAFRLANKAILIQQKRFSDKVRNLQFDAGARRVAFSTPFKATKTLLEESPGKGKWRPFQIAFLLLALKSTAEGDAPDREDVDLIWFPTGGGKTEAYFGLAAFAIFYRRLVNSEDVGVSVLMRYTLRLLTADQFDRASGLICALEYIRRQEQAVLGKQPFTIGIWLGQSTTPNRREEARKALRDLQKNRGGNKFLVTKCPWCSAQLGAIKSGGQQQVHGYEPENDGVKICCPDPECDFHERLPVYVVDEDIYQSKPTLIIGTVDKFAQITWNTQCRSIFGLDDQGQRQVSPPGLIIQDELHLISGPLGSMVGLYETLIEELCTDYRLDIPVKPKIVCSTATIRRFEQQIRALFGRSNASLFPSPGMEASDSFFAKWEDHAEQRGRKYIGIYAPGESIQTMQVRTMSIALQSAKSIPEEWRDPWWTLLIFFNSLRELGTTITLFQSDILTRLLILQRRNAIERKEVRALRQILELTSRLKNDEIDGVRSKLKQNYLPAEKNYDVIDVCLASNIIEVGVDISRLGLMAIVGQPKTTAQYIQVSGRVGRTPNKPGLILTIYSASKPRDRSHFEKFRTYHERLYAQVEPTSVTPFSGPALDRALHAVIIGYLRQTMPLNKLESPWPIPEEKIAEISEKIETRISAIYGADKGNIMQNAKEAIQKFMTNWRGFEINKWEVKDQELGLIYRAGSFVEPAIERKSKKTLQSMRNVDMGCQGVIAHPIFKEGQQ